MSKNKVFDIFNELRGEVRTTDMLSIFLVNYYLSRKLKEYSYVEFIKTISDQSVIPYLQEVYEGPTNFIKKFEEIEDISKEDLLSIVLQLSEELGRYSGDSITPTSIVKLGLKILDLKNDDIFLDYGSGIGATLLSASSYTENINGIEINRKNFVVSWILLDLFDVETNDIINADALKYDLNKFSANKVFMNMPLSLRMPSTLLEEIVEDKFKDSNYKNLFRSSDLSWLYAADVIENSNFEKMTMIVNGGPLYSDSFMDIRKLMVANRCVEAVIALPSNLLPYTAIPIYLIVFSSENEFIKFVDATDIYTESKHRNILEDNHIEKIFTAIGNDTEISKSISLSDLADEEYTLDPIRYTAPDFPFEESLELKDVISSISRGSNIRKDDLDSLTSEVPTNYQYLMLNNFQDGILDDKLTYLTEIDTSQEKFLIKDNSIIMSRISPFKIGSVDKLKTNILANGNLFILEVDENIVDKDFLTAYLQSRIGLRELDKYSKGTVMKTISIRDLEKVKVPKLPLDKQREIAKKFILLNSEFKAIKKRTSEIINERLSIFEGGI